MDKLSLRRALYEDPRSVSAEELLDQPQLQQLQQELQALDDNLRQQLAIEVPPQLVERVLLNQRMLPMQKRWYQRPLPYATAAALLVSVLYWQQPLQNGPTDLGQHALSHVYHEMAALRAEALLSQADISPMFSQLGIHAEFPVPVRYARFCDFDGVRSLHLVLDIDGAAVTLFVVPGSSQPGLTTPEQIEPAQFADARFFGQAVTKLQHRLVLVAEQPQLLAATSVMLEKSLRFNI
jgi:hypothetical protein